MMALPSFILAFIIECFLRLAAEQEKIERKQKTLERLRREALRRGIKIGPGSASEPDILIEPLPEPKSITEAKLRAKLLAKKKKNEVEGGNRSLPVTENLSPKERIPPLSVDAIVNSIEGTNGASGDNGNKRSSKSGRKKKGKRARENARQERDAINESIREKLAALKARKERIREIQKQLLNPDRKPTQMDEAYLKAQEQLKNLTAMREHLEELRKKGEELPDETAKILEEHLAEEEGNPAITCSENNEVETSVREEFNRVMISGNAVGKQSEECKANVGYSLTKGDCQCLISIEQALQEQKQLLLTIASRQTLRKKHPETVYEGIIEM
uniref:Uncharacterized protein n=1 Tax=Syphacia muris TaxID=451379 RepID=A0A0N5AAK4_9BILA